MPATRSQQLLNRIVKRHRKWVTENDSIRERELQYLEKGFSEGKLNSFFSIAGAIHCLAIYYGKHGMIRVLDGNLQGWCEIERAFEYRYWDLKLRSIGIFNPALRDQLTGDQNFTNYLGIIALLLCYFLLCEREEDAQWLKTLFAKVTADSEYVWMEFWQSRVMEPFIMWLYATLNGNDCPISAIRDLGPYQAVITHWHEPEALGAVIESLANYHCAQIEDRGQNWNPEFKHVPFDLVPVELLAIYHIRASLGLPTPSVDHPLLSSPLAYLPETTTYQISEDPILKPVVDLFNERIPGN